MDEWIALEEFPDYEICRRGLIRNKKTQRVRKVAPNAQGVIKVLLMKEKKQYTRSVAKLVATTFIREPEEGEVVVHKDEDHANVSADNLEWKPRWFAQERAYQSKRDEPLRLGKIMMDATGVVYDSALECAKAIDGIEKYIILCAGNPGESIYMGSTYRWVD